MIFIPSLMNSMLEEFHHKWIHIRPTHRPTLCETIHFYSNKRSPWHRLMAPPFNMARNKRKKLFVHLGAKAFIECERCCQSEKINLSPGQTKMNEWKVRKKKTNNKIDENVFDFVSFFQCALCWVLCTVCCKMYAMQQSVGFINEWE